MQNLFNVRNNRITGRVGLIMSIGESLTRIDTYRADLNNLSYHPPSQYTPGSLSSENILQVAVSLTRMVNEIDLYRAKINRLHHERILDKKVLIAACCLMSVFISSSFLFVKYGVIDAKDPNRLGLYACFATLFIIVIAGLAHSSYAARDAGEILVESNEALNNLINNTSYDYMALSDVYHQLIENNSVRLEDDSENIQNQV